MNSVKLETIMKSVALRSPEHAAAAQVLISLSTAAKLISNLIRYSDNVNCLGKISGNENADGDSQKALDVLADKMITDALSSNEKVALYCSEEQDLPVNLNKDGILIVACDPLDGSSNIDTNVSVGTIFSILPARDGVLQIGRNQVAAGFFVYGPQTTLLVSFGDEVISFQLRDDGHFYKMTWRVEIPNKMPEFAINSSNQRHWNAQVSSYMEDCLSGEDGCRRVNFNMRWVGSLVADSWRIFRRGGIFLYPADARVGYQDGRLRLIYEANAVAFLVEAAGGVAIDGEKAILDIVPQTLHQRVPFVFGSAGEVDEFIEYGS